MNYIMEKQMRFTDLRECAWFQASIKAVIPTSSLKYGLQQKQRQH